jgi:hypothetical protein
MMEMMMVVRSVPLMAEMKAVWWVGEMVVGRVASMAKKMVAKSVEWMVGMTVCQKAG